MGGIGGGGQAVRGISQNVNERNQRLNETLALDSARSGLDQRAITNFLVGGGRFLPGYAHNSGQPIEGFFGEQPSGPAFNLVQGGLETEEGLSQARQNLANIMLNQAPADLYANRRFQVGATDAGFQDIAAQQQLLGQSVGSFGNAQGLNNQLTGNVSDFFSSGGAVSPAIQGQLDNIFGAQREAGLSDFNQQFQDQLRQAEEQFATRGLRAQDTPAQDLTGRTIDEFSRNLRNFELGLSGQQSQAAINVPFQQAQLAGGLQNQSQNQMLNLVNAFSQPINQGFNSANQLNNMMQFGSQFTPASFAGPSLQNLGALLGQTNPSPVNPVFNQAGIAQNPSFGQTFGQGFAGGLGSGFAGVATLGASSLLGGLGSPPSQQQTSMVTPGLNLPPGTTSQLTPF